MKKMNEDKYLRVKQVIERTGLSRPTIYNMMNAGTFPNKTALGERAVAWLESEIVLWMEARKTIEKVGREAKPGRPPSSSLRKNEPPPASSKSLGNNSLPLAPAAPSTLLHESDDWGQNNPFPTEAEMNAIRSRLALINKEKKLSSTTLKSRGQIFEYRPVSTKK